VLRVPWRADAADTRQLLYRGFYSVLAVGFGVFFAVGLSETPVRVFRRNISTTLVWLAPGVCTFVFTLPWLDIPDNNYSIASCLLFYVAAAYLFFFAFDPKDKALHGLSVAYGLLAVFCLLWGATALGGAFGVEKIYSGPNARLVLAPDTPEAALQGVRLKPGKQCLISEPVNLLLEVSGDDYWLILPNKTTVRVRKDKVLGTLVPRAF
jgi:hypothetical protein